MFGPVGIVFKGSGFYKTDNRSSSTVKAAQEGLRVGVVGIELERHGFGIRVGQHHGFLLEVRLLLIHVLIHVVRHQEVGLLEEDRGEVVGEVQVDLRSAALSGRYRAR